MHDALHLYVVLSLTGLSVPQKPIHITVEDSISLSHMLCILLTFTKQKYVKLFNDTRLIHNVIEHRLLAHTPRNN